VYESYSVLSLNCQIHKEKMGAQKLTSLLCFNKVCALFVRPFLCYFQQNIGKVTIFIHYFGNAHDISLYKLNKEKQKSFNTKTENSVFTFKNLWVKNQIILLEVKQRGVTAKFYRRFVLKMMIL